MQKILSLIISIFLLCSPLRCQADEPTKNHRASVKALATLMTAIDLVSLLTIAPLVYAYVSKHLLMHTDWPWFSWGAGIGAGVFVAGGFSEGCKALALYNTTDNSVIDAVDREHRYQRNGIFNCALIAAIIGFFCNVTIVAER